MGNQEFFRRIYKKMEFSSQWRDMLLLVMALQTRPVILKHIAFLKTLLRISFQLPLLQAAHKHLKIKSSFIKASNKIQNSWH